MCVRADGDGGKENAAQMIYAREPARVASEPVCVCVFVCAAKLAAVVG